MSLYRLLVLLRQLLLHACQHGYAILLLGNGKKNQDYCHIRVATSSQPSYYLVIIIWL